MKNRSLQKLFIAVFFALFLLPNSSKASHAAGGELIYTWVSDSTYRFIFKFYRDCSGIPAANEQTLCIGASSSCYPLSNTTVQMTQWTGLITGGRPNGSPVSTFCPAYPTKCQDITSAINGYEEWWYSALVTLPGKCDHWTFSTTVNARNPQDNLVNIGTMYIEATLNNLLFQGNSSPYLFVPPVPYFPINIPYQYSNGAADPNTDSLVTELIVPLNAPNDCFTPVPAGLLPGFNTTNNPFPTGNTFVLNSATQQMSFTPTTVGTYTMTTKVSEYRGGVLVGYINRDIQSSVINYTPSAVATKLDSSTLSNVKDTSGILFRLHTALPLSFCFDIKAIVPGTVLVPYDNHSVVFPGSTLTYTNNRSDSVRGCFSWTPSATDSGIRMLTIVVQDSSCNAPGIATYWSYSYPVSLDTLTPVPTAIHNLARLTGTVIYPNPAKQILTVRTPVNYSTASISNGIGQVLLQQEIDKTKAIDIGALPAGLYYLQLRGKNVNTETLKFTKE